MRFERLDVGIVTHVPVKPLRTLFRFEQRIGYFVDLLLECFALCAFLHGCTHRIVLFCEIRQFGAQFSVRPLFFAGCLDVVLHLLFNLAQLALVGCLFGAQLRQFLAVGGGGFSLFLDRLAQGFFLCRRFLDLGVVVGYQLDSFRVVDLHLDDAGCCVFCHLLCVFRGLFCDDVAIRVVIFRGDGVYFDSADYSRNCRADHFHLPGRKDDRLLYEGNTVVRVGGYHDIEV